MNEKYKEIYNLPHKQSNKRAHMSNYDRAAQFAPFAALSGHEEAISEAACLTNKKTELDEYQKDLINEKLRFVCNMISVSPEIEITFFVPDKKKSGGEYRTVSGNVRKILLQKNMIIMSDGSKITVDDISDVKCPLLDNEISLA